MGALDLVAKAAKAAKKTAPFFSKADVVLDELQRGKGTGNEFLTELIKKGAKPTELKERGIEAALKDKPKMSKAEVQKVFEEKAPPKVQEKVLRTIDEDELADEISMHRYGVPYHMLDRFDKPDVKRLINEEMEKSVQYENWKTPGGENYREILLKFPAKSERDIADEKMKAFTDRVTQRIGRAGWDFDSMTPAELIEYDQLNNAAMKASTSPSNVFASSHWKGEPNVLAHIRVQDFKTPEGKKVLLVDEIQSDWHQAGRKKGYADPNKKPYTIEEDNGVYRVRDLNGQLFEPYLDGQRQYGFMTAEAAENAMKGNMGRLPQPSGVPDAPFKKNWHELAMKRVLDYAAENGYDTVAITPGAEQAKRYDLSKHIADLQYDPHMRTLTAWDHDGKKVISQSGIPEEELPNYIGKEAANNLLAKDLQTLGDTQVKQLFGADLTVGGEGMKGFYDKILPDYLNTFGKPYGSSVGELDLVTKPGRSVPQIAAPGIGHFPEPIVEPAQTMKAWSFDITPQLREEVKAKGLPLYSKMGMGPEGLAAGTSAATIGANMPGVDNEQQVQNPVHFTENPDAMHLELMQRN